MGSGVVGGATAKAELPGTGGVLPPLPPRGSGHGAAAGAGRERSGRPASRRRGRREAATWGRRAAVVAQDLSARTRRRRSGVGHPGTGCRCSQESDGGVPWSPPTGCSARWSLAGGAWLAPAQRSAGWGAAACGLDAALRARAGLQPRQPRGQPPPCAAPAARDGGRAARADLAAVRQLAAVRDGAAALPQRHLRDYHPAAAARAAAHGEGAPPAPPPRRLRAAAAGR